MKYLQIMVIIKNDHFVFIIFHYLSISLHASKAHAFIALFSIYFTIFRNYHHIFPRILTNDVDNVFSFYLLTYFWPNTANN